MRKTWPRNVTSLHVQRQLQSQLSHYYQRHLHITPDMIQRLGLQAELEGHQGCVNCLEWNEKGNLLASSSDDVQIILWDPFRHKKLHSLQTGHHNNVFSVKFMPESGDNTIVSGAGDNKICVHDIRANETTQVFSCHAGRVKRLATAPGIPYLFWSASEDATVMQFDLRVPPSCSKGCDNVLVNLTTQLGSGTEAKCLAVNPLRPELLAVGANDPYVRLFDRRMIKLSKVEMPPQDHASWMNSSVHIVPEGGDTDCLPPHCCQYFVAGHLPVKLLDYKKQFRTLAVTYLTFGPEGNELLANLGGEQIYLFDINQRRKPRTFDLPPLSLSSNGVCRDTGASCHVNPTNGYSNGLTSNGVNVGSNGFLPISPSTPNEDVKRVPLPPRVEDMKQKAGAAFEKQQYDLAINLYNEALSLCPKSAILHGNRAAAFMKRAWDGDMYAAIRDCYSAIFLDPNHLKAHFRLARCLFELRWTKEASECLQIFKNRFPEHASSHACKALDKDIQTAIFQRTDSDADNEDHEDSPESNMAKTFHPPSPLRPAISEQEREWQRAACDYETRYCGHCNTTTDIKEANFFGSHGQYIVAGSDDGSFFIWDRKTTNIIRILHGDESIVNCLQPHPECCLMATSGIDPVVRLWSPLPEDGSKNDRVIMDPETAASANQRRMNADPLEVMLIHMGYRLSGDEDNNESRDVSAAASMQCRPS